MNKKDLSYQGRTAKRQEVLLANIDEINLSFKQDKILVRLDTNKDQLLLRYRDPSRKRKQISPPGVSLSIAGIELARQIAHKIHNAIVENIYTDEWLQSVIYHKSDPATIVNVITWGDVLDGFKEKWLAYRSGDPSSTKRQKSRTLVNYLCQLGLMDKLTQTDRLTPFDADLVNKFLALHAEGTDKRSRLREAISIACSLYGLKYDFKNIGKRPIPGKRELPDDSQIITTYKKFQNIYENNQANHELIPCYKWMYGMMATYGLRPQELFAVDPVKSFRKVDDYWISLDEDRVDGLKTGNREIAPLMPEWVELFDLTKILYPPSFSSDVSRHVKQLGEYFRIHKIGLTPYTLRHCYAIRCRRLGISLLDAAEMMGHDPQTHYKQYHRWIGKDERINSVRSALARNKLADENSQT